VFWKTIKKYDRLVTQHY